MTHTHLLLCNLRTSKFGAYEEFLVKFAERIQPNRLVVALVAIDDKEVMERFERSGVQIEYIPLWQNKSGAKSWNIIFPAIRLIRKWKPDSVAVHFGNELPTVALIVLSRMLAFRPVWIWHQHQQICDPGKISRYINRVRILALFVDQFVAVYEGGRKSLYKRGVAQKKILVVHNGIVDHDLSEIKREDFEIGINKDSFVALTVGWLVPRKRIDWVIKSWRQVMEHLGDKNAFLLIAGDGPKKNKLVQLTRELGIERNVIFLGQRNDIRDVMRVADIYVHAAFAETCTYTITESMCAGIPAVVTEAGAAYEQIEQGKSGFVVPPDDMKNFVSRIVELANNRELRKRMGENARRHWLLNYDLNSTVEPLIKLYESIGKQKGVLHD